METRNVEIWALRTLRSGLLYLLVGIIMFVIAAEAGYLFSVYLFDALIEPAGIMGALIVFGLLMLVSLVISLYAIFGKIRPGIRQLSQIDSGFRICYTGTTFLIAGLLIVVSELVVAAIIVPVEERPAIAALGGSVLAFGVIIIGGIISLIGYILTFMLGAFRLHSRYQNSLYMAAGILFVVDILLTFLGLGGVLTAFVGLGRILAAVGYVLMYMALGDTINKLGTATTTPAQA
jgi:hypothetical protein